jgi:hypothetical protein
MKKDKLVVRTYVGTWNNVMKKVRAINRMAKKHGLKESSIVIEEQKYFASNGRLKVVDGAKLTWSYIV